MTCNGQVVFTGTSTHCFIDGNGRPVVLEKQLPEFYAELKKHVKQ